MMITGIGSLSYGELAGERMKLGLLLHDPEEEHDCFSDNTHNSHYYNVVGMLNVYGGEYKRVNGSVVKGASLSQLVRGGAADLDTEMRGKLKATLDAMTKIKQRAETKEAYDQMLADGNAEGNAVIQAAIDRLTDQTRTLERVVASLKLKATFEGSDSLDAPDKVGKKCLARAALAGFMLAGAAQAEASDQLAGAATVRRFDAAAFSQPSANMAFERQLDFRVGDGIFRKLWVPSPSSTKSSDGLGPLLNARGCQSCHLRDGRGRPPAVSEAATSMVLRLSIPPQTDADRQALATYLRATTPEPTYGGQLQNFSVNGLLAEGRMTIAYTEYPVTLTDGEVVRLRKPRYGVTELNYGPLHRQTMISPRVAPPMIGLGLLEMIPKRRC